MKWFCFSVNGDVNAQGRFEFSFMRKVKTTFNNSQLTISTEASFNDDDDDNDGDDNDDDSNKETLNVNKSF